jgi:ubiquitin C-terminal hydrolase
MYALRFSQYLNLKSRASTEFFRLVHAMNSSQENCENPRNLKRALSEVNEVFCDNAQHDVGEAISTIMGELQNESVLSSIFKGIETLVFECGNCGRKEESNSDFPSMIPLFLSKRNEQRGIEKISVKDLLKDFYKKKYIPEYQCKHCSKTASAMLY